MYFSFPALKSTLEMALKKVNLSLLISSTNRDEAARTSLINCLMTVINPTMSQQDPRMFEGLLIYALTAWKNAESSKLQQTIQVAYQQNADMQQKLDEMKELAEQAKRDMARAKHAADMAQIDKRIASNTYTAARITTGFRY